MFSLDPFQFLFLSIIGFIIPFFSLITVSALFLNKIITVILFKQILYSCFSVIVLNSLFSIFMFFYFTINWSN